MYYIITKTDGTTTSGSAVVTQYDNKIVASVAKETFTEDILHLDFCPDFLAGGLCETGYAIVPRGTKEGGTMLCRFREREDCEYISDSNTMPIFGWKDAEKTVLAIVTGMTYEYKIVVGVKDNTYYLYPRFFVNDKVNYEDITVEYHVLDTACDYNDMAAFYKSTKNLPSLAQRVRENAALAYAAQAPELRIRLCWKPVPAKVFHQTPENEPPVTIGCTLARAKEILDGMKAKGIDKIEVCLVGIETRGHDGRWPQLLPIEEAIGGQEQLEALCQYGQSLGYQMVVHTNSTEMYEISNDWNENVLIYNQDGTLRTDPIPWGGGLPFFICPACTGRYTKRNLRDVHAMGFRGLHYIDVLTNFPPKSCFHPLHPVTPRDSEAIILDLAAYSRELFGGFASEGGFDYAAGALDYVLYSAYNLLGEQPAICDELVPFWQLVYHGTILYNPTAETVNYAIKDSRHRLKFIEYGGRPLAYINSKYVDEGGCGNWMGEVDLLCSNESQLEETLDRLKQMYDEYLPLCHLQYEAMLRHDCVAPGIYRVTYESGTTITVDYNTLTYRVENHAK